MYWAWKSNTNLKILNETKVYWTVLTHPIEAHQAWNVIAAALLLEGC